MEPFSGKSGNKDEWFQLFEKDQLCPERMTDTEKERFEELTKLANEHLTE